MLHALAASALVVACAARAGAQPSPDPTGYAILARVKAGVRAAARPPFVSYTLIRRDSIDGVPDLGNSYTLRVWCRTSDGAALSRRMFGSRAGGGAQFIVPAFNGPIDPGPPTADLLDVIRQTQAAPAAANSPLPWPTAPESAPAQSGTGVAGGLRVIGSVSAVIETAYRVRYAGRAGSDDHLELVARRDPERNRLTDLYVDHTTSTLHRAVAHDRLFIDDGRIIPERFEIEFGVQAGVPVIVAIHGQTDVAALDAANRGEPLHETAFRFEDIAFPSALPDWYFEPADYGAHRNELPG